MDEVDLPPLSQSTRKAVRTPPRPSLLTRKRTRSDYDDEPATSSDPALFSSDEQAPGAENYVAGKRKKRTYRGSWWDRQPDKDAKKQNQRKGGFKRNFDSGIFMGSESEEPLSSDSFTMEDELLRDQQRNKKGRQAQVSNPWPPEDSERTPRAKMTLKTVVHMPKEHEQVCTIVRECLDRGEENVDLSSMSLSSLPPDITALQTLSKQDELVPGMLHLGTDLEPHLRLYLACNLFTRFPTPIVELRNLRVLSLRNNNLASIPPTIRELVNLESLNIAGNQLTELPFEIIELALKGRLAKITSDPNPWIQPQDLERDPLFWSPLTHPKRWLQLRLAHSSQNHVVSAASRPMQNHHVPTLTEMTLRQLSKLDPHSNVDFRTYLPPEAPENVLSHLTLLNEHPSRRCTNCKRPIVLAGREWIEWWCLSTTSSDGLNDLDAYATILPFRRLQCRDGCQELENIFEVYAAKGGAHTES